MTLCAPQQVVVEVPVVAAEKQIPKVVTMEKMVMEEMVTEMMMTFSAAVVSNHHH